MKLKKLLTTTLCIATLMAGTTSVYAATSPATTPVNLVIPDSAVASIDVTVPESITLTAQKDSLDLATSDKYTVTNNSALYPVTIANVKATPANGWEIKPYGDDFTGLRVNTKKVGINFANDGSNYVLAAGDIALNKEIAKSGTVSYDITAKAAAQSDKNNATKIADIVLTLSF